MPRTSRADKNLLSYAGDTLTWYAGTPDAKPCERPPTLIDVKEGTTTTDWDSALKVSATDHGIYIDHILIPQCRENALDINHNTKGVTIKGVFGRSGGRGEQVITIKGGSTNATLAGAIDSTGTNADIVIGQWSDQSTEPSSNLDLRGLFHSDDRPLTVIIARARSKTIKLPPGAKVLRLKSALYTIYWWAKFAAVKVGLFS